MRRAALLIALALLAGCQLQNRTILLGSVISSPVVAGVSVTTAQLFLGERQTDLQQAPTGLAGATVTLTWDGNPTGVTLTPVAGKDGWYQATGNIPGATGTHYQFKASHGGEVYTGAVQAPAAAAVKGLPTGLASAAQLPVTVSRDGTDDAFYAVFKAVASTDFANATCTNAPLNDAGKLVQFVLDDSAWKAPSFVLARTPCFPDVGVGAAYVVSLFTVVKSMDVSTNLFLGSAVLAGSPSAGALVFGP